MTMLAMWLDETSVALATDSKMTGSDDPHTKLHCVQPDKVIFGIGFGEGPLDWLVNCPCDKKHPYPEHWCSCSQAENVDELERIIQNDLKAGSFPPEWDLELWLAGVNRQGILEAFILNGAGIRTKELTPGEVIFNGTSQDVYPQHELILKIVLGIQPQSRWQPEQKFWGLKTEMDNKQIEFSGAEALKEICQQLIDFCEANKNPYIGGRLDYHMILH